MAILKWYEVHFSLVGMTKVVARTPEHAEQVFNLIYVDGHDSPLVRAAQEFCVGLEPDYIEVLEDDTGDSAPKKCPYSFNIEESKQ